MLSAQFSSISPLSKLTGVGSTSSEPVSPLPLSELHATKRAINSTNDQTFFILYIYLFQIKAKIKKVVNSTTRPTTFFYFIFKLLSIRQPIYSAACSTVKSNLSAIELEIASSVATSTFHNPFSPSSNKSVKKASTSVLVK